MAFTKGMKKGLSVLLSLAMVVTSVSVNGKKAEAGTSAATISINDTVADYVVVSGEGEEKVTLTVSGKVKDTSESDDSSSLKATVSLLDGSDQQVVGVDGSSGTSVDSASLDFSGGSNEADYSVDLKISNTQAVGNYKIVVDYQDKNGDDATAATKNVLICKALPTGDYNNYKITADTVFVEAGADSVATISGQVKKTDAAKATCGAISASDEVTFTVKANKFEVASAKVNTDKDGKFTTTIAAEVAKKLAEGTYTITAKYTNKDAKAVATDETATKDITVKVNPSYIVSVDDTGWTGDGKEFLDGGVVCGKTAGFAGSVSNYTETAITGGASDKVTFSTDNNKVTVAEAAVKANGTFEATIDATKVTSATIVAITAKYTKDEKDYEKSFNVAVTPDKGTYAELAYSRHGKGWDDVAEYGPWYNGFSKYVSGFDNAPFKDDVSKAYTAMEDLSKDGEYTVSVKFSDLCKDNGKSGNDKVEWTSLFNGFWLTINDYENTVFTEGNAARVSISKVTLGDKDITSKTAAKVEVKGEGDRLEIALAGSWYQSKDEKTGAVTDNTYLGQMLDLATDKEAELKVTIKVADPKVEDKVATVSAISTTQKAITATAGAATTVAMTVNVAGKNLDKVDLAKAVSVAAVSAAGVTVKVSSKAVTGSAATLEAVLTIPATVATGAYPVVAILDTKTVSAASVAVEKVQLATLSVVETPAAPEVPADEKVATTKLKLATSTGTNKITMGVGETAKIKVTQKPKKATDEITAASSKKAVVKASLKAKNVVLKAKKAGVAKVTVAAGEVSKKLTVTVKKAPKKLTLKDGKKAAKKTVKMTAKKTKKKAVKKSYKIVLPKNTASYGYTIKKTGKAAKKITATVNTSKKGVQTLVVTAKKKAAGAAKVVITSNANKKAKATVNVKASK